MLKIAANFVALMLATMTASAQGTTEDGRIHITFFNRDRGSGPDSR